MMLSRRGKRTGSADRDGPMDVEPRPFVLEGAPERTGQDRQPGRDSVPNFAVVVVAGSSGTPARRPGRARLPGCPYRARFQKDIARSFRGGEPLCGCMQRGLVVRRRFLLSCTLAAWTASASALTVTRGRNLRAQRPQLGLNLLAARVRNASTSFLIASRSDWRNPAAARDLRLNRVYRAIDENGHLVTRHRAVALERVVRVARDQTRGSKLPNGVVRPTILRNVRKRIGLCDLQFASFSRSPRRPPQRRRLPRRQVAFRAALRKTRRPVRSRHIDRTVSYPCESPLSS